MLNLKTFFKTLGLVLFVGTLLVAGTFLYIVSFYTNSNPPQHDCVVVFGAAVWPGGNPSHALADRTYAAIEVYKKDNMSCIIFSGADSVYGKHEVDVMLEIAYEEKVELEDVILDYDGLNTKRTLENLSKEQSYLLVSNDFHLARIDLLARKVGVEEFDVHNSAYRLGRYSRESYFVMREIVAFWYYAFGG